MKSQPKMQPKHQPQPSTKVVNLATAKRTRYYYRWNDVDPDLEAIANIIIESGLTIKQICDKVSKNTGGSYRPSEQTINNWLAGIIRRPQNFIMNHVGLACGKKREWTVI
jgi:hypothetical protein